jgi:hypothetical protein
MGAAVVLGSGAYALGTQSGDGSASADPQGAAAACGAPGYCYGVAGRSFSRAGREADLAGLAASLGVDKAKLQQALKEIRA